MADIRGIVAWVLRSGKRIAVSVIGFALIVAGIILLPLPGPGWLIIFAGLAVLATEYVWARRALDETKKRAGQAKDKLFKRKPKQ